MSKRPDPRAGSAAEGAAPGGAGRPATERAGSAGKDERRRRGQERAAFLEASRCLLCEDPPCRGGCPADIDPRTFIRKIRFADLAGAARHLRERNVLAGACAYLCPASALCVGRCLHEKLSTPIDIPALQRFVCEWERAQGLPAAGPEEPRRGAVAIVGAGPAGLSCAAELARRSFAVTIFERAREAGGVLRAAIPEYRLPREVLDRDAALVAALGVRFRYGEEVRSAADLLGAGFGAVFVATGAGQPLPLRIRGEQSAHVRPALHFMRAALAGAPPALGRRVAVIGGGNTAVDAARLVARTGREVVLLYRRGPGEMPAYRIEVEAAVHEGVEILFRVMPVEFLFDGGDQAAPAAAAPDAARLTGIRLQRVRWHGEGRAARTYAAEGAPFDFPCDDVLVAVGARPEAELGLAADRAGLIGHDPRTLMTSVPGVFAGGDVASGPATAVAAVGMGKAAAEAIEAYLVGQAPGARSAVAGHPGPPSTGAPDNPPVAKRALLRAPRADLGVRFCGIPFENPFLLAAGPPTDDLEMVRAGLRAGWAGAVLKTTSVAGTPVSLAYPMMSAPAGDRGRLAGLGNIDLISIHPVEVVAERVRALKQEFPTKVIAASIMGSRREDWESLVGVLEAAGVDLIECSFSCPQGTLGSEPGAMLGQDPELVRRVAGWVKAAARRAPVVIKLTPQVASLVPVAAAVKAAGCDAICASNTLPALTGIDLDSWVPSPDVDGSSAYAGLSGAAIRPVTLRAIAEIARHTDLPVTGTGGPVTWADAVEFFLAGATTVQFCTAVMRFGFVIIEDLCEGLGDYLDARGLRSPAELIGKALPRIVSHEGLLRRKMAARIDAELCIGDGGCVVACRDGGHGAIRMLADRVGEVDPERCVGCGLCELVCPVPGCVTLAAADA